MFENFNVWALLGLAKISSFLIAKVLRLNSKEVFEKLLHKGYSEMAGFGMHRCLPC